MPDEITCLIVDDHEVVREGLWLSLSRAPHIRVVGEAAGCTGMVGGQAIDLQAAGQAPGHPLTLDGDDLGFRTGFLSILPVTKNCFPGFSIL